MKPRSKCEKTKLVKVSKNRCERCGCYINGDGYFIPKCLCDVFEIMEGNDYEDKDRTEG